MVAKRPKRAAKPAMLAVMAAICPALAGQAAAQLIQIRTVPVATGDQFLTTPSANFGMAGLTYAVDDSIADGWSNPAKGVLLSESSLLSAPVYYWISDASGRGFTLPVGGLIAGEKWFGGVTTALQEIDNASDGGFGSAGAGRLSDMSRRNLYAGGFVGRRLGSGAWSLGIGASTARLQAMDGVDLLYAGADRIVQSGSIDDVRLGVYRDAGRDRASAVLVRNSISMAHDVTYVRGRSAWTEQNLDQTRTWGLQLAWDRRLRAPGWRIGASVTANRKSHPRIPNYDIQNIPRDPGNSTAFELGFGVARSLEGTTAGLDIAVQPIGSDTWQEAEDPVETAGGTTIPAGGRTIENDFSFLNLRLRVGLAHEFRKLGVRLGLEGRSYGYTLEQTNHVEGEFRTQNESWVEWTPAAGAIFRLGAADLHYGLRLTTGTGRPVANPNEPDRANSGGEFVVAPGGPLGLMDTGVLTHQFWVRIPIR